MKQKYWLLKYNGQKKKVFKILNTSIEYLMRLTKFLIHFT